LETKISKQGDHHRIVEVDVPQEELTPRFDAAYRKYQKNIRLEGFRKGRVPLSLIKKIYGDEIQSEAIDEVVKNVFKEISTKENIQPVAPAKI
jgi:trigger factor